MKNQKVIWLAIVIALAACRPTELLQDGKTKFYKDQSYDKLAVIAFPGELLDVRVFENTVSKKLRSKDLEVVSTYQLYEGKDSIPADVHALREDLRSKGYNGTVEVKLVSIRNVETNTGSDYVTNREYRIMDVANYGKLVQEYTKRENKGETFEDVKVKMDVRLVDLRGEEVQVIWSARTETTNPKDAKDVAIGMTQKAIKALKKEQIL